MAKTPTTEPVELAEGGDVAAPAAKKAAKKPAKKAAKKKTTKPRKAAKSGAPAIVEEPRTITLHGETRLIHVNERDQATLQAITGLIDEIHALTRIVITSAASIAGVTTIHAVLPGHPVPYDQYPGIILTIDADNVVSFDHVVLGYANAVLIDDAVVSLFAAMQPDQDGEANHVGRRLDWFERAVDVAEDVGIRHDRKSLGLDPDFVETPNLP